MIQVRTARPADAVAIGAVHVAAWRSTYAGILPGAYLRAMSAPRQAAYYDRTIRGGGGVHVATVSGLDAGSDSEAARVVAFATTGLADGDRRIGEGEVETLYVLDDWRERGLGRRLIHAAASALRDQGCRSAFLWVLRDNPSRWFYARLGGRAVMEAMVQVGGVRVPKVAYLWDPIDRLMPATSARS